MYKYDVENLFLDRRLFWVVLTMKTKNWLFLILIVLLLFFVFFVWLHFHSEANKAQAVSLYQNPILRVQFEYPSEWTPQSCGLIQGYPTQYKGKDGFFVVNALPLQDCLSESVQCFLAENQLLFGKKPTKEECIIHSRVGYFIYPQEDLAIGEDHPICYVTELSNPAYYNGQTCSVLTIFSTEDHIHELINTLEPFYPY